MLPKQKDAVERNMGQLIEAVKPNTPVFLQYAVSKGVLSYDEKEVVETKIISVGKVNHLLNVLITKDSGWSLLQSYLRGNNQSGLAEKLLNDADMETPDTGAKMIKRSALEEFSVSLAQYYKQNYTGIPTMGDSPKHVKDVWVPLQIDGNFGDHLPADRIDHIELLNRLKSAHDRNVAIIKGDPGMGKTTLAKKIAYDWAVNYGTTEAQPFTLVLAVPLRNARESNRFDQLAIDYFFSKVDMEGIDKRQLTSNITRLKSQLLVILDGLDEYGSYSESPFKLLFEPPFQHSSVNCGDQPQMISFKLIITSRPYACERIQTDFPLLRFVILPLDASHLSDFVNLYCQTRSGIAKVIEYLKVNAKLVIKVPLILTFVCFLADSMQEIPTNMTSLYYNLIWQMIRRENRQGKLEEPVDLHKWKEATVVKTTGKLAFREISRENLEFTSGSLARSNVTNDSFICGFLLHKYDIAKEQLKAEFPHRSIQEFFAALYSYQRMLSGRKGWKMDVICGLIFTDDSQFGRFLFGICSLEGKFRQMTSWLNPSFGDYVDIWSLADEINQFGTSLLDCSPVDHTLMGQKLQRSIGHAAEKITRQMRKHLWLYIRGRTLRLLHLSAQFKEALNLVDLTRDPSGISLDWCVAENRQLARLAVVTSILPELPEIEFHRINIFIWYPLIDRTSGMEWKTIFSQIECLPPLRKLFVSMAHKSFQSSFTTVSARISYGRTTSSELKIFGFQYDREQRKELLEAFPDAKLVKLTENKRKKKIDHMERSFIDINVTVDRCESQSALIYCLIRLALV